MIVSLAALGLASPAIAEISCKILNASSEIINLRLPASLDLGRTIFFAPSYKLVGLCIANYYLSTGEGLFLNLVALVRLDSSGVTIAREQLGGMGKLKRI